VNASKVELKGLLIRTRAADPLGAAPKSIKLTPLFPRTQAGARSGDAFAAAPGEAWFMAEPQDTATSPWDLAHAALAGKLGLQATFVEPDLEQAMPVFEVKGAGLSAASRKGQADPQDETLPMGPGPA
jgi:hypothetical protein